MDGGRFARDIEPVCEARFVNPGETMADETGVAGSEIEPYVSGTGAPHFGDDGAGNDVAGREIEQRMVCLLYTSRCV